MAADHSQQQGSVSAVSLEDLIIVETPGNELFEIFVGRVPGNDGLRLIGYRPHDRRYNPPAQYMAERLVECGRFVLPEGRSSMKDLRLGDKVTILEETGHVRLDGSVYQSHWQP